MVLRAWLYEPGSNTCVRAWLIILILIMFLLLFIIYRISLRPSQKLPKIPSYKTPEIPNRSSENRSIPTLHSRCREATCGGTLICDTQSHRCKQCLGGPCSTTTDCVSGLVCENWRCQNSKIEDLGIVDVKPKSSHKKVTWKSQNEIFPIPSRKR